MLSIDYDTLEEMVSWIPAGDLLPTALVCTQMRDMCIARASRETQLRWDRMTGTYRAARWRTHAASSISRARWAIAMGATPNAEWCIVAAEQGDLSVLQWVRLVGAPWDGGAYWAAARAGHLHVLNFLLEHRCPFENEYEDLDAQGGLDCALIRSATGGHLAASQWLHKHGAIPCTFVTACAAGSGQIPLLNWLFSIDAPFDYEATMEACECEQMEALHWLHAHGVPWNKFAFDAAAAVGSIELLQFMHANGARWGASPAAVATRFGNFDTLKYLRDTGASLDTSIAEAAHYGHIHILHWLFENGARALHLSRHHPHRSYPRAASVEVLEVLHAHGVPLDEFCVNAAFDGKLDMLHWLHEHDAPLHPCAVALAAREGHFGVLEWLRVHRASEPDEDDIRWAMSVGGDGRHGREWLKLVGFNVEG